MFYLVHRTSQQNLSPETDWCNPMRRSCQMHYLVCNNATCLSLLDAVWAMFVKKHQGSASDCQHCCCPEHCRTGDTLPWAGRTVWLPTRWSKGFDCLGGHGAWSYQSSLRRGCLSTDWVWSWTGWETWPRTARASFLTIMERSIAFSWSKRKAARWNMDWWLLSEHENDSRWLLHCDEWCCQSVVQKVIL